METYSFLRELADSWVLLGMFAFFIAAGIWAFLPSQANAREDASMIPFRNETAGCSNKCTDCKCANTSDKLKGTSHDK
jgi:cytochrome c oxidase cbb3-type subunit 4